jgi:hypothetical protein
VKKRRQGVLFGAILLQACMVNPYPPGGGPRAPRPPTSEPDLQFCSDVTAKARSISFWETFAGWSAAVVSVAAFTDGTGILPLHTPGETTGEKMEAAGLVAGAALSAAVSYMLFSRAQAAGALAQSTEQALADLQDPDAGSDESDGGSGGSAGSDSAGSGGSDDGAGSDNAGGSGSNAGSAGSADVTPTEMVAATSGMTKSKTKAHGKHSKSWRRKAWRVVGECNAALAAWDGSRASAAQYATTLLQQEQAQTNQAQGSADAANDQADAALQQKAQSDQVAKQASAALQQSARALTPTNAAKACGADGKACPELKVLHPELFKAQ